MNDKRFWEIIDRSRSGCGRFDEEKHNAQLTSILQELEASEIVRFKENYELKELAAYRWDLWAMAYIIQSGCSDDGFSEFREWIVSQGREFYESTLANPEYLSEVLDPLEETQFFHTVYFAADHVYEKKTKQALIDVATGPGLPAEPAGHEWEEEELPLLFPEACRKFGFVLIDRMKMYREDLK
jgi:hypothetical protein